MHWYHWLIVAVLVALLAYGTYGELTGDNTPNRCNEEGCFPEYP